MSSYKKINAINFSWDDYAYLAMDDGLVSVSSDRGKNFGKPTKIPVDGDIRRISASNKGTVLAANANGYAISFDHGTTWVPYGLEPSEKVSTFSTPNDHPGVVWVELVKSYPAGDKGVGGVQLLRYTRDRPAPEPQKLDQEFDLIRSTGDFTGWGIKGAQIFVTQDGGRGWQLHGTLPLAVGDTVRQVQQFGDQLSVGSSKGRLFWVANKISELPSIPSDHLVTVSFTGGYSAMAVATNNVVLYTRDFRSETWTQRIAETSVQSAIGWAGETFLFHAQSGQLRSFDVGSKNETVVVDAMTGDVKLAAMDDLGRAILSTTMGELLSSNDAGRSWAITLRVPSLGPIALGKDGFGVAISRDADVFQTTDGGQSWSQVKVDLPGAVTAIAISDRSHAVAQIRRGDAWRSDYVLYSIDDAKWTPLPGKADFGLLRWGGPQRLFGIKPGGEIQISFDGGR
ncbi:hypothetical protein, partial [Bradyrhizobium sp. AS23.2]|uniref:sialidase family protein n=1 Tax=Bradyrhizobium sp. AS23.2 TaxID=1680155 RepID=UPI001AD829B6